MKNKAIIGGIIALVIIVLVIILCFWAGKKINDKLRGDNTNVSQPTGNQPPPTSALPTTPEEAQKVFLTLGNPSNANRSDDNNYLLVNNYMVISYNRDKVIPNWVAWRVTKANMSDLQRVDSFRPDDRLERNWKRATPSDYTGSNYDRGHVSPSADHQDSAESMASSFVMTNMTPQTPDLNRGPWEKLESYLRTLVVRGSDVYIVAGVYGDYGKLKNKVTIPTNDWKIAVAVPAGTNPLTINENARVIAVDMPNVRGIRNADWQTYRTTVAAIEQSTGLKFLTNLPPNVQNALKAKQDNINN